MDADAVLVTERFPVQGQGLQAQGSRRKGIDPVFRTVSGMGGLPPVTDYLGHKPVPGSIANQHPFPGRRVVGQAQIYVVKGANPDKLAFPTSIFYFPFFP